MAYARDYTGPGFAADLQHLFRHQLAACALAPGETCLAITDTAWNPSYAAACQSAARALGAEAFTTTFAWDTPPPAAALDAVCRSADLIVYMTGHALHYRDEFRHALARGARILCCMEPPHVLARLKADPVVRRRALAGAELLHPADLIHVTSDAGTDLRLHKTGRPALANYGAADAPGRLDFWGIGAVQAAQLEGTTEGRLVLDVGDCCFKLARYVERPVTIIFEAGRIAAIEGGLDAALLRADLEGAGDAGAWAAGHMAWGVDHRARWTQAITQTPDTGGGGADSESSYGGVQIQIGSNDDVCFGGTNRSAAHLGLCLRNASLSLDGVPVIAAGRIIGDNDAGTVPLPG
jgi:2,5-dihydroxypyridine 5,6-dioxygenase